MSGKFWRIAWQLSLSLPSALHTLLATVSHALRRSAMRAFVSSKSSSPALHARGDMRATTPIVERHASVRVPSALHRRCAYSAHGPSAFAVAGCAVVLAAGFSAALLHADIETAIAASPTTERSAA